MNYTEANGDRQEGTAPSRLPPRQYAVATLVAAGLSNKEIATQLGITPNTVRNTLTVIFDTVGLRSRAALASAITAGRIVAALERLDQSARPRQHVGDRYVFRAREGESANSRASTR